MTRLAEIIAANKHGEAVHLDRADFDWLVGEVANWQGKIAVIAEGIANAVGCLELVSGALAVMMTDVKASP